MKTAPCHLQSLESHFLRIEDWVPPEAKILTQLSSSLKGYNKGAFAQKGKATLKSAFAQKVRKSKFAKVRKANLKNAFA